MAPGLWDYIKAAFHAKPLGMFLPPNWIFLGVMGMLGLVLPGFWILGAGMEIAYLYTMATNGRFQRMVQAVRLTRTQQDWRQQLQGLLKQLPLDDQARYSALERRCQMILEQQSSSSGMAASSSGIQTQSEGLGKLVWIYLRLLLTRHGIEKVLRDAADRDDDGENLDQRAKKVQEQIANPKITDDLRKSLTGQLDILNQRKERQQEARDKLAFLDSELTRIAEQVELIREQAALSTDPEVVSQRIDQITATLGGTTQWIQEQQQVYGRIEDMMARPVPIATSTGPTQASASESA